MNREETLQLVEGKFGNMNLLKHSLAVEACMKRLAKNFGENEESWAQAGLLHDLDYDETKNDFSRHGLVTAEILEKKGVDKEIIEAIKAHTGHYARTSKMAKSLYAVDPLTGLIVAAVLMHPEKKLSAINAGFIFNRFKEKHFARGADREQIKACQELEIELQDFITLCLGAMKEISQELGF